MIFDCTERYDPVTKQWASVASLNFPRCGVGVCPCHGALYALGNCQFQSNGTAFRKSIQSHGTLIPIALPQVVGLGLRLGKPWNAMIQKKTSGRSSATWLSRVITSDAVSYKVRLPPCFLTYVILYWRLHETWSYLDPLLRVYLCNRRNQR